MLLSDMEIKSLVESNKLIENFNIDNIQAVSYDITSSNVIRVFERYRDGIDLRSLAETEYLSEECDITTGYEMLPGEYILVKLRERINMPDDIAGHIRPRTTYTKLGLILSNQHINPGYCGHLYVGLRNVTQTTIKIYPGLAIGQIVFEKISGKISEHLIYDKKKDAKYQNEDEYIPPRVKSDLSPESQKIYDELLYKLSGGK